MPDTDGRYGTMARYREYAERIMPTSPTYAAWAISVNDAVVDVLLRVAPTKRQPELAFAVARRLGARTTDPLAFRAMVLDDPSRFAGALADATMQANDPQRLAPTIPVLGMIPGPIGLVDVGASASLCSIPDHVHLRYRTPDGDAAMTTSVREPSIELTADVDWPLPAPVGRIDIVARVALDPAPIDVGEAGAFNRLVEAVPPEATQRVALMGAAARIVRSLHVTRLSGTVPDAIDAALDLLPPHCTPVVLTSGTLVYVPGLERQRFVDRLRDRGVRWVAFERTGILHNVATTMPSGIDPDNPDAFATVSLDGTALAVADAYGTRIRWFA